MIVSSVKPYHIALTAKAKLAGVPMALRKLLGAERML